MSRNKIATSYGSSIFNFWEMPKLISTIDLLYITTNGSSLSTSSPTLVIKFVYDRHFDWSHVVSQGSFNWHLPNGYGYWAILKLLLVICTSFWKLSIKFVSPFVDWQSYLLGIKFLQFFVNYWYYLCVWNIAGKGFLSFCQLSVCSVDSFPHCEEIFSF